MLDYYIFQRYRFFPVILYDSDYCVVVINFNHFHFSDDCGQNYNGVFRNNSNICVCAYNVKNFTDVRAIRASALYSQDEKMTLRKSHESPVVKQIYDEYLGEYGSHKAHELLHTSYVERGL